MIHALRQIRAVLTIARLNNFTRAAAEMHLSQSALTVQVKQLEQELGIVLFDRNKRRVALTQSGIELLAPLEAILVDAEAVVARTREINGLRCGRVAVAVLSSIGSHFLPRVVRKFTQLSPGVNVRIVDGTAERVVDAVIKEEVDFGISALVRTDKRLASERLFSDRFYAFAPKDHLLAGRTSVSLRELAAYPLLVTARNTSAREIFETALKREGIAIFPAYEANYVTTVVGMVHSGLGIAVLPGGAAELGINAHIRRIPIAKPALSREICLLQKKGRCLSPAAGKMIDVLRQSSQQLN